VIKSSIFFNFSKEKQIKRAPIYNKYNSVNLIMGTLTDYETYIISALAQGATIKEVRKLLQHFGQKPNSESSIDKKLQELRKGFQCKTTFQLIYKLRNRVKVIDIEEVLK
tara:strand:+ start:678 stop:1007 length:330 start_codon:yes stop_codon:yes gene_type:complete